MTHYSLGGVLLGQEFSKPLQSLLEIFINFLVTPAAAAQLIFYFAGERHMERPTVFEAALVQ